MTDDAQREGLLTANRIAELQENPVNGSFDVDHLKQIHYESFKTCLTMRLANFVRTPKSIQKHAHLNQSDIVIMSTTCLAVRLIMALMNHWSSSAGPRYEDSMPMNFQ